MKAVDAQCCGVEVIGSSQSCCNTKGYNPALEVCADYGDSLSGCGTGNVCPLGEHHVYIVVWPSRFLCTQQHLTSILSSCKP